MSMNEPQGLFVKTYPSHNEYMRLKNRGLGEAASGGADLTAAEYGADLDPDFVVHLSESHTHRINRSL